MTGNQYFGKIDRKAYNEATKELGSYWCTTKLNRLHLRDVRDFYDQ